MTPAVLIDDLRQLGVELWAEGDRLRYRAPKGVLTEMLRRAVAEHKLEILDVLCNRRKFVDRVSLPAIVPAGDNRYEPFALNEIQQAYWIGRSGFFELGNVAAHVYGELEGTGLDLERAERAWQRLIDRHEMLRAVVLPEGRQQILAKVPAYRIEELDLSRHERSECKPDRAQPSRDVVGGEPEQIRSRMSHEMRPTDQWPLFEVRASRLKGDRVRIHISLDLLIADAWSIFLLVREWGELYANPEQEMAPLELSFRDYVLAESALEETELSRRSERYWQQRLARLAAAPELPLACSPGTIREPRFVRRSRRLEPAKWSELKRRARQSGVTPSMVLCTAFAEVLGSWSKSSRFTINVTMFNRLPLHREVNQIVGDFTTVNLLEVERKAGSFQEQAERLQQQMWDDMEHRYWSGLRVMRELNRAQGGGAMAAMPVVFTSTLTQTTEAAVSSAFGWLGELVYGISQTPQVWLDHQVYEDGGALVFNWDAVEELFPAGMLEEMFEAYTGLLERLSQDGTWESTDRALAAPTVGAVYDRPEIEDKLLQELFHEQAAMTPHATAVVGSGRRLSYEELQKHAREVAAWLRERGVGPNRLVAVVMEKGWEQVVAVLGVLESGAAYLPIEAGVPAERLRYLLEHGQVKQVLTQSWLETKLEWPEGIERLSVDAVGAVDDRPEAGGHRPPLQKADDLAYVIYTSGSTGQPKGVMIDHRGAVNTILEMNRGFGVSATDRVLAVSSLSFDLSVYDIFGVLAAGGTIVLPSAEAGPDPAHWVERMAAEQVTVWNSVPALMEMLVEYVETHPTQKPEGLRQVWMSGDWIPVGLPDRIRRLYPGIEVISLGGATEASIWSIYYRIDEVDPNWKSIPYGRALANQKWAVRNELMEPCPVWVPGQLYIGGVGLAKGYWRDDEKTASSFILDEKTGERWYRTGDLGRYLPDGTIEFLGREDFQVKVQGYRIELGEIETALEQHAGIRTAVVSAVGERNGPKRLVAYVVGAADGAPDSATLRQFLEQKLPDYMIPTLFIAMDTLPLTPNGKVDRRALPHPEQLRREWTKQFIAPRNPLEMHLARIWEQVLHVEPVGVTDDFFELGGNSLLAVRLMARLQQEFTGHVSLETIFQATTVERLAELLDSGGATSRSSPVLVEIQPAGSRPPFFCVHPIGGNVLSYRELAGALGADQRFYGVQAVGLSSIEAMAAHYIEHIRTVQPEGPYLIGGASMGGVVAYEMAQQLQRRGEAIGLLALLDPQLSIGDRTSSEEELFRQELAAVLGPVDSGETRFHNLFEIFAANLRALRHYTPSAYSGRVTLFRPEQSHNDFDWERVARDGVDMYKVSGDHFSMLRSPHVEALAARLKLCLDAGERREAANA